MKILLTILILLSGSISYAASINAAAYRTMQMQAYQRNRYKTSTQRQVPYWQAQSNYTTRNRIYTSYPATNSVNNGGRR